MFCDMLMHDAYMLILTPHHAVFCVYIMGCYRIVYAYLLMLVPMGPV